MTDLSATASDERHDPKPAAETSSQRRQTKDLRHRVLRHYLPIALASSVALVVFMNLPYFNVNRYPPPMDIMVEGLSGAIGEQGGTPMGPGMDHGGGQPWAPTAAGGDQSGTPGMDHGAGQAGAPTTEASGEQFGTPGMDHGAGQAGAPTTEASGKQSGTPGMDDGVGQSGSPAAGASDDQSGTPPGEAGGMSRGGPGGPPGDTEMLMRKYSTATGYIALVLLGLTLLVGPANLLRRRRSPLSSYLCRDVGVAAATLSVAHVIFGFLTQHNDGIVSYFFEADDRSRILTTSFGLANWTGLAAVVIVAALAAISSDWALRKLKAKRWKRIQRLNYILFPLVVAHSVLYGALLRLTSPYSALLGVSVVAVLVGQVVGIRLWRQRNARKTATVSATA